MAIHFIGDLHLDHKNIIRYCHRPFRSIRQMNTKLVKNWNEAVSPKDTVFFLGDLANGRSKYWLRKMNGNIVLIGGNHDPTGLPYFILHHGAELLLLIHDPVLAPPDWPGWVVHGHKHNNNLGKYPFINRERRTINVSAELINYRPINLRDIEKAIREGKNGNH